MFQKNNPTRNQQVEMISLDEVVPEHHLVRKIDKHIDFTFIYDLVRDKYCPDNGRPGIDPVVLMKLVILQYMFGIKSMRQTIKEVEVNVAYRWFLGLGFNDPVPHFTTFGKNYERRFKDTDLFEQIFQQILKQAIDHGFVNTKVQFVDATHVKAHANRHKYQRVKVVKKVRSYQDKLDQEIQADREAHGKKELPPKDGPDDPGPDERRFKDTDPTCSSWMPATKIPPSPTDCFPTPRSRSFPTPGRNENPREKTPIAKPTLSMTNSMTATYARKTRFFRIPPPIGKATKNTRALRNTAGRVRSASAVHTVKITKKS